MRRCVIFCAGERGELDFEFKADDFIICCDAGLEAAGELGITPHLIMGDFDSCRAALPDGIETLRFLPEKDYSDSLLAVIEGMKRGYKEFWLLFSLGGRMDHSCSNLQTLAYIRQNGCSGALAGPGDTVRLVKNGRLELARREGYSLSVFAFGGPAKGVTLSGVKYQLSGAIISESLPVGLSNEITAERAVIEVADGALLVIQSRLN